jgi:hypothetical protein
MKHLVMAPVLAAWVTAVIPAAVAAQPDATDSSLSPIVGSWRVTGDFGGFVFHVHYTFTADGNVLVNVEDGRSGNGAWAQSGPGEVTMTFLIPGLDEAGAATVERLRETIVLPDGDGIDSFEGHFHYQLEDAAGTILSEGPGTVTATRIEAEAPPSP